MLITIARKGSHFILRLYGGVRNKQYSKEFIRKNYLVLDKGGILSSRHLDGT